MRATSMQRSSPRSDRIRAGTCHCAVEPGGTPLGVRRLAERSRVASQDPDRFGDTMSTRTIAIAAFVLVVIVIVVVFVL
jgi:hypothetical protein